MTVSGLAGAVAITAGNSHSCALLGDGTARCWGWNLYGELGNGTTTQSTTPVTVSGLSGAVAITAGGPHSCALLGDGTARCWGSSDSGQLGNPVWGHQPAPVQVVGFQQQVPCATVNPVGGIDGWTGDDPVAEGLVGTVGTGAGRVGSGLVFDGTNVVTAPGIPVVSEAVSVELWVKPTQTGRVQALMSRWHFPSTDDTARSFNLLLAPNEGGQLLFETDETSTRRPEPLTAAVPTIFDGQFHHVAATWDRTTMRLFFDGVEVASKPSQGGTLNPAVTVPFRLGGQTGAPFGFTGTIDEPSVWGRALSPTEINDISTAGPKCP